jgi:hypothetical protein
MMGLPFVGRHFGAEAFTADVADGMHPVVITAEIATSSRLMRDRKLIGCAERVGANTSFILLYASEVRYAERMIRAERIIPAVLAEVIRKAPLCPEKVDFAWRSAVGPALARVTNVRLDDAGVLWVMAADAQWAQEVKRSSRLILSRLETLLGKGVARKIQVR